MSAPLQHLAVIPDGNRRWAEAHGCSVAEGHKEGYRALKNIADAAIERGISILTAYAFSTENWQRTPKEVKGLMDLMEWVLTNEVEEYHERGVRLRCWGRRDDLTETLQQKFAEVEELTSGNKTATFNLCFNYGGRQDLIEAVNQLLKSGKQSVTEGDLAAHLVSSGAPDPDLIIRTSGERRLSNFLVWEGAYSELYFTETLWPDFDEAELDKALADYAERKRRFGK